eukprot:2700101-Alexandrium_andersonii.AAC.1
MAMARAHISARANMDIRRALARATALAFQCAMCELPKRTPQFLLAQALMFRTPLCVRACWP